MNTLYVIYLASFIYCTLLLIFIYNKELFQEIVKNTYIKFIFIGFYAQIINLYILKDKYDNNIQLNEFITLYYMDAIIFAIFDICFYIINIYHIKYVKD